MTFEWSAITGWLLEVGSDLIIGVVATLIGILVVYAVARPRIEFSDNVYASRNPNGTFRYGIRVRPRNRLLILSELRITAHLLMGPEGRRTSVPVPLSRDTWRDLRRARNRNAWPASPQLFLKEIEWKRYLTRNKPPQRARRLESILHEKNADLVITVVAVSTIFAVTSVTTHHYTQGSVVMQE